jgi:hypothetical protein
MIRKMEVDHVRYLSQLRGSLNELRSLQKFKAGVNVIVETRAPLSDFSEEEFKKAIDARLSRYTYYETALINLLTTKHEVEVKLIVSV